MTVNTLPMNLPDAPNAKLPATYEAAQKALAECNRVDEAWTWQNKAHALASYARQARDNTLRDMALRIQARATRRAGELLRMIPSGQGTRTDKLPDGADRKLTRAQAAHEAGMSERQQVTAQRVASIPVKEFETTIEDSAPPTMTELAMRGTASRPAATVAPVPPADPALVARAGALLLEFAAFCAVHDPVAIARGAGDTEIMRGHVETLDRWLDRFVTHLAPAVDSSEPF